MAARDRTEWVASTPPGAASSPPGPGPERLGKYRLLEEIGEGGMGVVHLALDPRGRAVAIKVLRTHVAHDDDARHRLGREVETLSRVRDDRVASVIDADVMGPRPYVVTRYVPGAALDETVEEFGPLGPDALLRLARGTAEAIRAIHACGVVHRDIKPGNVLLEDGEPVLIDFGIAHLQDDVRHTVGGLVMGTPGYLSPELVEGAAITDATDWWGWAATITYAASGRPPFGRGRMDVVLSRVRAGEVDLDGIDPRLAPLLRASLSPNPSERPHADEVIDALERYAAGHAATVPPPSGGPWDDPAAAPPVGSTQVMAESGTAVLPAVAAAAPRPSRWAPPTERSEPSEPSGHPGRSGHSDPAEHREPAESAWAGPAAYDVDVADGPEDGRDEGNDGWDAGDREGDPRIGLALRTGLLTALAAVWLGLFVVVPVVASIVLVLWCSAARATDRTVTGLVLRRYVHGRRRSDVPYAVALTPWNVVMGVVATAVSLLLPAAVTLAGMYAVALLLSGTSGDALGPGTPVTLGVGGLFGLLMMWRGPGGASLRRGTRSVVRTIVPEGLPSQVATGVLGAAGALLAILALTGTLAVSWLPLVRNPFSL